MVELIYSEIWRNANLCFSGTAISWPLVAQQRLTLRNKPAQDGWPILSFLQIKLTSVCYN